MLPLTQRSHSAALLTETVTQCLKVAAAATADRQRFSIQNRQVSLQHMHTCVYASPKLAACTYMTELMMASALPAIAVPRAHTDIMPCRLEPSGRVRRTRVSTCVAPSSNSSTAESAGHAVSTCLSAGLEAIWRVGVLLRTVSAGSPDWLATAHTLCTALGTASNSAFGCKPSWGTGKTPSVHKRKRCCVFDLTRTAIPSMPHTGCQLTRGGRASARTYMQ